MFTFAYFDSISMISEIETSRRVSDTFPSCTKEVVSSCYAVILDEYDSEDTSNTSAVSNMPGYVPGRLVIAVCLTVDREYHLCPVTVEQYMALLN